jgi:sulfate transport system substrate-binding protein
VVDGLEADVVTLAMWPDTDNIRKVGLISDGWEQRFPNNSTPYLSPIVFLVRKGNPKGIKDWADIVKPGVEIVTPNPKTSGNGKLSFLAAWGAVLANGGREADAKEFVTKLFQQAPVPDAAARGASVTFAQKGIGDGQLTWENEAHLQLKETPGEFEIICPARLRPQPRLRDAVHEPAGDVPAGGGVPEVRHAQSGGVLRRRLDATRACRLRP